VLIVASHLSENRQGVNTRGRTGKARSDGVRRGLRRAKPGGFAARIAELHSTSGDGGGSAQKKYGAEYCGLVRKQGTGVKARKRISVGVMELMELME
jgi:hypothetical protein